MNSSKLRFLVDVGVGKGIEKYLRGKGYNTKAVRAAKSTRNVVLLIQIKILK